MDVWNTLGAEAVVTFLLVLAVVSVALNPKVPPGVAAVAVGSALAAAVFISGPITGAGVNPARAIGPMIADSEFADWWAYLLGPLVGAAVAASLYDRVFRHVALP